MKRFFDNLDSLHRFTLELDQHTNDLQCQYCAQQNHFVSHGFIYRQCTLSDRQPIGKRIVCSNRHGHGGCGRTVQLYLAQFIPSLHYTATHIVSFLHALLARCCVKAAYHQATGQHSSRQAWRWLNRLERQQVHLRGFFNTRPSQDSSLYHYRTRRLQLLLPLIERLFSHYSLYPAQQHQLTTQAAFL